MTTFPGIQTELLRLSVGVSQTYIASGVGVDQREAGALSANQKRQLNDIETQTREFWKILGLDASNPLSVTDTSRSADDITQTIADDGTTTTVTRT